MRHNFHVKPTKPTNPSRRWARCLSAPETLVFVGGGPFDVADNPLPRDVKIIASFYDQDRAAFCVVLESASFAPVPPGAAIPEVRGPVIRSRGQARRQAADEAARLLGAGHAPPQEYQLG